MLIIVDLVGHSARRVEPSEFMLQAPADGDLQADALHRERCDHGTVGPTEWDLFRIESGTSFDQCGEFAYDGLNRLTACGVY